MEYIEIEKKLIPYHFEIGLDGKTYNLHINYNKTHDFFTVDLYRNDKTIILGEKLVYNQPLFTTAKHKDVPNTAVVPFDLAGSVERITYENLNSEVFLFLVGD